MSTMTARALTLAAAVALWTIISHLARLPLQVWPVILGLACFLSAGGGVTGLQRSIAGSASGVIWAMFYVTVSGALGRQFVVDALVLGAAVVGMVYQARVPLLAHTGVVFAGTAAALGTMGIRSVTLQGGIRVLVMLAIGAALGYGAEYLTGKVRSQATSES